MYMDTNTPDPRPRARETGFTLVEAIVAIVVLSFGLMAVTNLLLVAASSNSVANQGSAAVTSATHVMDMLRNANFPGGIDPNTGNPVAADPMFGGIVDGGLAFAANDGGPACSVAVPSDYHCNDRVPGVGLVHTHWYVTETDDGRVRYIRVRAEGTGALSAVRSRAEFTTFRACTLGACPPRVP
jgi:type II secretory pathway pseudopilin PulG